MRILFYINAINGGGAERVMVNLANRFSKEPGNNVTLVTSFRDKWEYQVFDSVDRISLESGKIKQSRLRRNISRIIGLRRIIEQKKPDLVVSFMAEPNYRAIIATLFLKVKTIISVRNDPNQEYHGKINTMLAKWLLPFADGCVFQTMEAMNWFPNRLKKKSKIILNAVKDDFFAFTRTPNRFEVVSCGRLQPQKNHAMLIEAFTLVNQAYPGAVLKIYGSGQLHSELEKKIHELGMKDSIKLMGSTEDVPQALRSADLFVLSSDYEGMPNALMEALAMGIPSVSTDCPCGGPQALIKNGVNGFLVPVGDVEAMAEKIIEVLSDKDGMDEVGRQAKIQAESFRSEAIYQAWKSYFVETTGKV